MSKKNYIPEIHIYFILRWYSIAQASQKLLMKGRRIYSLRFIFIGVCMHKFVQLCECHVRGDTYRAQKVAMKRSWKYFYRQLRGTEHKCRDLNSGPLEKQETL